MKKEVEEENNLTTMINEINRILEEDYFHVNIRITEEQKVEWTVYYKNLKENEYFSGRNKPLLTSRKNTIADIYILKAIFEELKQNTKKENGYEFFKDNFKIYFSINEIRERASLGMLAIFSIYVFANMAIIFILNNYIASFYNAIVCFLACMYYIHENKKINKLVDKAENVKEEVILKNIIKGKGLSFVKELRNELHNKGVYKYGINEKAGEKINKSI